MKPVEGILRPTGQTNMPVCTFNWQYAILGWAVAAYTIGWTRRIPVAEWRNRGGGRGERESPADAEHGCCGGRESCCGGRKKCFGGRESCWGGKMTRIGAGLLGSVRVGRDS